MHDLKNYIINVSNNLDVVFEHMSSTVEVCNSTAKRAGSILETKRSLTKKDIHAAIEVEKLKESVLKMATLFQFGDIISQSFESFDVIFEELNRFKTTDKKLDMDQAERFAKLLGAVSTSTFSLIGTTLLQLKDQLERADGILKNVSEITVQEDFLQMIRDSKSAINSSSRKIEGSTKYTVSLNEKMGLFCIKSIISSTGVTDSDLVKRLYDKFRVRAHVDILNEMFPENKEYSNMGSLELF